MKIELLLKLLSITVASLILHSCASGKHIESSGKHIESSGSLIKQHLNNRLPSRYATRRPMGAIIELGKRKFYKEVEVPIKKKCSSGTKIFRLRCSSGTFVQKRISEEEEQLYYDTGNGEISSNKNKLVLASLGIEESNDDSSEIMDFGNHHPDTIDLSSNKKDKGTNLTAINNIVKSLTPEEFISNVSCYGDDGSDSVIICEVNYVKGMIYTEKKDVWEKVHIRVSISKINLKQTKIDVNVSGSFAQHSIQPPTSNDAYTDIGTTKIELLDSFRHKLMTRIADSIEIMD